MHLHHISGCQNLRMSLHVVSLQVQEWAVWKSGWSGTEREKSGLPKKTKQEKRLKQDSATVSLSVQWKHKRQPGILCFERKIHLAISSCWDANVYSNCMIPKDLVGKIKPTNNVLKFCLGGALVGCDAPKDITLDFWGKQYRCYSFCLQQTVSVQPRTTHITKTRFLSAVDISRIWDICIALSHLYLLVHSSWKTWYSSSRREEPGSQTEDVSISVPSSQSLKSVSAPNESNMEVQIKWTSKE